MVAVIGRRRVNENSLVKQVCQETFIRSDGLQDAGLSGNNWLISVLALPNIPAAQPAQKRPTNWLEASLHAGSSFGQDKCR